MIGRILCLWFLFSILSFAAVDEAKFDVYLTNGQERNSEEGQISSVDEYEKVDTISATDLRNGYEVTYGENEENECDVAAAAVPEGFDISEWSFDNDNNKNDTYSMGESPSEGGCIVFANQPPPPSEGIASVTLQSQGCDGGDCSSGDNEGDGSGRGDSPPPGSGGSGGSSGYFNFNTNLGESTAGGFSSTAGTLYSFSELGGVGSLGSRASLGVSNASSPGVFTDGIGIRQILTEDGLVDVEDIPNGYKISLYSSGEYSGSDHPYNANGTAHAVTTITDLSGMNGTHMKLVREESIDINTPNPMVTETVEYLWMNGGWLIKSGFDGSNYLKQSFRSETDNGDGTRTVLRYTLDADNTEVYRKVEIYTDIEAGAGETWRITKRVVDPNGKKLTTLWQYNTNSSSPAFGDETLQIRPTGDWIQTTYHATTGYRTKIKESYLNAALNAPDNQCRVTEYLYVGDAQYGSEMPGTGDTTRNPGWARRSIIKVLGQEVSRNYVVLEDGTKTIKEYRATVAGAAWDDPTNLETITEFYGSGHTRTIYPDGTIRMVEKDQNVKDGHGDGINTNNDIDLDGDTRERIVYRTTIKTGQANTTRDDVLNGTKTVAYKDQTNGVTRLRETYNITTSGQTTTETLIDSERITVIDSKNRATTMVFFDGTTIERSYVCCGLEWERNRQGVTTYFEYDALKRMTSRRVQHPNQATGNFVWTEYVYDAEDRTKETKRIGTDGSVIVTNKSSYNVAGQLITREDALGHSTTVTEVIGYDPDAGTGSGERTVTTNYPDGGTMVEVYHRDGQLKQVTGSAIRPYKVEYGVESNQTFRKEIKLDGSGTPTSEWTKTLYDLAGRISEMEYADGAQEYSFYYTENDDALGKKKGKLSKTVDADGNIMLYAYDAQGRQNVVAIDMDQDSTIDFDGSDRITQTERIDYLDDATHGEVYRTLVTQWDIDGNSNTITLSQTDTSFASREQWTTVAGNTSRITHTATSLPDASGQWTVTTTYPDGTRMLETYQNGYLMSRQQRDAYSAQLTYQVYVYDEHGRLRDLTDARNGTTTTTYTDKDEVYTVTTPSPDGVAASQVTTYSYDTLSRKTDILHPDGKYSNFEYFKTGDLKRQYGEVPYEVDYTYDAQGRMETMTTYYGASATQQVTTWFYDGQRGWLTKKQYPGETDATDDYNYWPSGRLYQRTWERNGGILTTYGYNNAGDLETVDYSDTTQDITYGYNRRGLLDQVTDAAGTRTLTYYTDRTPWLELISGSGTLSGYHLTHLPDALGRRQSLSLSFNANDIHQTSYSYDADTGRYLSAKILNPATSATLHTATYGYLANSNLPDRVTFNNGTTDILRTSKTYDYLDRLSSTAATNLQTGPVNSFTYQYDEMNRRTKVDLQGGDYWSYGYNDKGEVISGNKSFSAGVPVSGMQHSYQYDPIGNRLSATINGNITTYGPNEKNQYANRTVPGIVDIQGSAATDAIVTVKSSQEVKQASRRGEYFHAGVAMNNSSGAVTEDLQVTAVRNFHGASDEDLVDQLTKKASLPPKNQNFTYDDDGNLTSDGVYNYTWNAENRLNTLEPSTPFTGAKSFEYKYDYQGRRIERVVRKFNGSTWVLESRSYYVYDDWNLIYEKKVDAAGTTTLAERKYLWGLDLSETEQGAGGIGGLLMTEETTGVHAGTHYFTYDGNGNVMNTVHSDGTVTATYEYDPFGKLVSQSGTYAPENPFCFSTKHYNHETKLSYYGFRYYSSNLGRWINRDPIEENGGMNLYAFVENDSINFIDLIGFLKKKRENRKDSKGNKVKIDIVTVEKCEVAILYGHGSDEVPHEFNFPGDGCSGGEFVGCHAGTTNQNIPKDNRLPDPDMSMNEKASTFDRSSDTFHEAMVSARTRARKKVNSICADKKKCCKEVKVVYEMQGGFLNKLSPLPNYSNWNETRRCEEQ
ncbi:MAG: RHS repeat-associated core domain-containing protein [Verrucomicrobiota bacterium]